MLLHRKLALALLHSGYADVSSPSEEGSQYTVAWNGLRLLALSLPHSRSWVGQGRLVHEFGFCILFFPHCFSQKKTTRPTSCHLIRTSPRCCYHGINQCNLSPFLITYLFTLPTRCTLGLSTFLLVCITDSFLSFEPKKPNAEKEQRQLHGDSPRRDDFRQQRGLKQSGKGLTGTGINLPR